MSNCTKFNLSVHFFSDQMNFLIKVNETAVILSR